MTYLAYSQPKSPEVWAALRAGFAAAEADPSHTEVQRKLVPGTTAILGGLACDQPLLLQQARETRHSYLFVDNGYFATHQNGKRVRYRIVEDAYAHYWVSRGYPHRFDSLGLSVKDWRHSGRHILVCTSSDIHAKFFGLQSWAEDTVAELRRHTDRPITIRRKGARMVPFEQDLEDAWAVVAWSSNVAVTAALAGVPVFTGPESPACPVGLTDLSRIETPRLSEHRLEWASSLAWGQFTVEEMASGFAARVTSDWHYDNWERAVA